ncbi:MAG: lycopene cyclase [Verrucomicrobia bacterium]|nr:lycopene cyclase [Verrucomicrobiota bacterium]
METDLLILGGGAAGLSLARRLAEQGAAAPRTLVLESRAAYVDDRTWCFWMQPSARLPHLVRRRWAKVSLASPTERVVVDCAESPYAILPSGGFYEESCGLITQSERVRLAMGVRVLGEPRKVGGLWEADTSAGVQRARWVVDTRPPAVPAEGAAVLWQSFLGVEIESVGPVFDPAVAEIMHFTEGEAGQILFHYILPLSPTRALLEVTAFAPAPAGPDVFRAELGRLIQQRLGERPFRTRREEHGILPMGLPLPKPAADPTFVRAGLMAGGARASSGYAFQRIQRWAETCAQSLAEGLGPRAHAPDGWILSRMDALFLQVLRRRPELAPVLFLAMFRKVAPARLARFMSDQGTWLDDLAVIAALPPGPFLRELFRPAPGVVRP